MSWSLTCRHYRQPRYVSVLIESRRQSIQWHPVFLEVAAGKRAAASSTSRLGDCTSLPSHRDPLLILIPESRLNESNLILRGTEYEASSVVLKGTLVLCLSESIRTQGIKLRFTGERRLGSA